MTILDQGMLHCVLYFLYGRGAALNGALHIGLHLFGQILGHLIVIAAQDLCRLVDGVCDLDTVKGHFPAVPLDDFRQHSRLLLTL